MNKSTMIVAGLLLATALSALAARPVDVTKPAKPGGEVRISNVSGDVTISGWNKPEVHITGELGDDVDHLQVDSDGSGVEIRVVLPKGHGSYHDSDATLNIQLPAGSDIKANTVSADISASGVNGPQELETVSGTVKLESASSDITAKSVSGDVTVAGSAKGAHIDAHSVSGEVHVSGVDGELRAGSVSGEVRVSANTLTRATAGSTSGSVSVTSSLQKHGKYSFHSVSGNIRLTFDGQPDARFDINTFSGDIRNDFGPKATKTSEYSPGMQLRFVSGKGSAQVDVNTMSGDIKLEKK